MRVLRDIFSASETALPNLNPVIVRLLADVQRNVRRDAELLSRLQIHVEVVHLSEEPEDVLDGKMATAREKFKEMAEKYLPDQACAPLLRYPGRDLAAIEVVPPTRKQSLRFEGVPVRVAEDITCYVGLGRLADLVGLYETYDYALFAKNVRSFLLRKALKGPAKHFAKL